MAMTGREKGLTPLERKKKRLELYYSKEEQMLSPGGVKAYGIGTRNVQRYETALKEIQSQIAKLEQEIKEMESKGKPHKAVAVVPMDW